MATRAASTRLGKEAKMMDKDPPPFCYARPREDNLLEWHYILRGPPDTPFHGGEYWGQLIFPPEYPFKPPGIKVSTPSGRFHTNTKICTSMSDFHPGSWNPAWSVANILVGLLSFMCSDEMTTGSVMATHADRCTLAKRSHAFNTTQPRFKKMFPEYSREAVIDLPNMGQRADASAEGSAGKSDQTSATAPNVSSAMSSHLAAVSAASASAQSDSARSVKRISPQSHASPATAQQQKAEGATAFNRLPALISIFLALLAYLFVSRLSSVFGGSPVDTPASL